MKTTRYIREEVLRKRPYLKPEWRERVLSAPMHLAIQPDGRIPYWARIPEPNDRILRVVTLEDGETVLNAFPDRDFVLPDAENA